MECTICGYRCKNNNDLNAHLQIFHKEKIGKVFVCEICGKKDMALFGYLSHMRTHDLDKKGVYDHFHRKEAEGFCSVCDQPTQFAPNCNKWGYHDLCKDHDRERRNRRREATTKAKYGVDNVGQLDSVKCLIRETYKERTGFTHPRYNPAVVEATKATNLERYGEEYTGRVPSIKDKIKQTFNDRYENGHPLKDPSIRRQIEATCMNNYGVPNPMQDDDVKKRALRKANLYFDDQIGKRLVSEDIQLVSIGTEGKKNRRVSVQCLKCEHIFSHYVHNGLTPLCPLCYKSGRSRQEQELYKFFDNMGIEVLAGSRKLLEDKKEIDIFLPKYRIGIEYTGLYWHSTRWNNDNNHMLEKQEMAQEKDINLIQIYGDEWAYKKDIVQSMLRSRVGIDQTRIFARKCTLVREVDVSFYTQNHLQGKPYGKLYHYGLVYEGELVCALSLSPAYISREDGLELSRFVSKRDHQVIGGFSKMLAAVKRDFKGEYLVTFADKRYSRGVLYTTNGFQHLSDSKPGFYYNNGGVKRYSRYVFQKHKLANKLKHFDPLLTAEENLSRNGYYRVYDAGQSKFGLQL